MKPPTAAFETMKNGLLLRDAADKLHGKTDDGIEPLLFTKRFAMPDRQSSRTCRFPAIPETQEQFTPVTESLLWSS